MSLLTRLFNAAPRPWRRPPVREWRLVILDPDGMPSGDVYLLSVQEVARIVSLLCETGRRRDGSARSTRPFHNR